VKLSTKLGGPSKGPAKNLGEPPLSLGPLAS